MVALISATVFMGVTYNYPPPKTAASTYPPYPQGPTAEYNSPEYLEQQKKYEQDLKEYDQKTKEYENQSKEAGKESQVWAERVAMYVLIAAGALFVLGIFLTRMAPLVGVSFLFSAFVLLLFGKGGASFVSLISSIPLGGPGANNEVVDSVREYEKLQLFIAAGISIFGVFLGFMRPLLYEDSASKKSE